MPQHPNIDERGSGLPENELNVPLALTEMVQELKRRVLHLETLESAAGGGASGSGLKVLMVIPPDANAATIGYRTSASTPGENFPFWSFDPTTVEFMDFLCFAGDYNGGGATLTLAWMADGTNTGNVIWSAAFRSITDDAEDVDLSHTYVYTDAPADPAPSVDGEVSYLTIAFADGAPMDSWQSGEYAMLRVRRRADQGGDTMNSNNAQLWLPQLAET